MKCLVVWMICPLRQTVSIFLSKIRTKIRNTPSNKRRLKTCHLRMHRPVIFYVYSINVNRADVTVVWNYFFRVSLRFFGYLLSEIFLYTRKGRFSYKYYKYFSDWQTWWKTREMFECFYVLANQYLQASVWRYASSPGRRNKWKKSRLITCKYTRSSNNTLIKTKNGFERRQFHTNPLSY